jgi:hypothetical protein
MIHDTLRHFLGPAPKEAEGEQKEILEMIDTISDVARSAQRRESRDQDLDEDEVGRALGLISGMDMAAQVLSSEGIQALLSFTCGFIIAATQAVYRDEKARVGLVDAMGEVNRAEGLKTAKMSQLPEKVSDTVMSMSQLMSNLAYLSLLLSQDVGNPTVEIASPDDEDFDISDARPASEMPPELREQGLKLLAQGKLVISEKARVALEEKGVTQEQIMEMLQKAMRNG